jgi:hypothetical protein
MSRVGHFRRLRAAKGDLITVETPQEGARPRMPFRLILSQALASVALAARLSGPRNITCNRKIRRRGL